MVYQNTAFFSSLCKMSRKRVKKFPKAAITPEFANKKWDRDTIRIGGRTGQLDVNFCYNTMCGNFGLSARQAKAIGAAYSLRKKGNTLILECPECGQSRRIL